MVWRSAWVVHLLQLLLLVVVVATSSWRVTAFSTTNPTTISKSTTTSPPAKSTTPFSNRIKLDQVLLESEKPSPNFPKTWVPLAAVDHLDPDRPTPLQFLGASYVCYRDNDDRWVVMDNACPHRMAPLSEGRIERDKNTIECAYHGWQFDSDGKCQRIPQIDDARFERAVSSPLSCVASYPVMVEKGLLWAWLWSEDPMSVAGVPEAHPEVMSQNFSGAPYMRDMPYGWEPPSWKNLLDPAHVPFAHHGLQGTRDDAIPINMTVPMDVTPYGFRMQFEDRTMKNWRKGWGELRAPYVLHYQADFYDENSNLKDKVAPFRLSTVCIPTKPGWSRLVVFAGPGNPDGEEESKESSSKVVSFILKVFPNWLFHLLNGRFLDSDLAFLHYQEREARARNPERVADAYFMPAPADRCIAAIRTWISYLCQRLGKSQPLPSTPVNRDELFDRYTQTREHLSALPGCFGRGQKMEAELLSCTCGINCRNATHTSCLRYGRRKSTHVAPCWAQSKRSITTGGYDHYKT